MKRHCLLSQFSLLRWLCAFISPWGAISLLAEPSLEEADAQLKGKLGLALIAQEQRYAEKLATMEAEFVAERHYRHAATAQAERLRTEERIAVIRESASQSSSVITPATPLAEGGTFRPTTAEIAGGVTFDSENNFITLTGGNECLARWELGGVSPSGYTVRLSYSCSSPTAQIEISEEFFMLSKLLEPTEDGTTKTVDLGSLRIREGNGVLTACASGITSSSPIHVRSIELIPNP